MIIGSGPKIEAKKYGMVYLGIQNIAHEKSWKIGHITVNQSSIPEITLEPYWNQARREQVRKYAIAYLWPGQSCFFVYLYLL